MDKDEIKIMGTSGEGKECTVAELLSGVDMAKVTIIDIDPNDPLVVEWRDKIDEFQEYIYKKWNSWNHKNELRIDNQLG